MERKTVHCPHLHATTQKEAEQGGRQSAAAGSWTCSTEADTGLGRTTCIVEALRLRRGCNLSPEQRTWGDASDSSNLLGDWVDEKFPPNLWAQRPGPAALQASTCELYPATDR